MSVWSWELETPSTLQEPAESMLEPGRKPLPPAMSLQLPPLTKLHIGSAGKEDYSKGPARYLQSRQ